MVNQPQVDACSLAEETKPKRQVSYNQDVVLCPACRKRIRLNNNGRLRVHIAGKVGSDKCMGSNAEPLVTTNFASSNEHTDSKDPALFEKEPLGSLTLFSDIP